MEAGLFRLRQYKQFIERHDGRQDVRVIGDEGHLRRYGNE
jgi:hypothetical protein